MQYKLSKNEWLVIGKKTGWLKLAESEYDPFEESDDVNIDQLNKLMLIQSRPMEENDNYAVEKFIRSIRSVPALKKMMAHIQSLKVDHCIRGKASISKFEINCELVNKAGHMMMQRVQELKWIVDFSKDIVEEMINKEDFFVETQDIEEIKNWIANARLDYIRNALAYRGMYEDDPRIEDLKYFIANIYNSRRKSKKGKEGTGKIPEIPLIPPPHRAIESKPGPRSISEHR